LLERYLDRESWRLMNKYIERQEIDTEMERRRDEERNTRTNRGS